MQDAFGNYVLHMNSLGEYYPRETDGGGVGEQEVFFGSGSPVGVITPAADNAIYGNTDTGELHHWYDGVWH